MSESGLIPERRSVATGVANFANENAAYYEKAFARIQSTTGFTFSWNMAAALLGPIWGALRGLWGFFWTFLILELFALVQVGRGLWGDLGAEHTARYERLLGNIAKREQQAKYLIAAGDQADADAKLQIAENLKKVATEVKEKADLASQEALTILLTGLALLLIVKLIAGLYANLSLIHI